LNNVACGFDLGLLCLKGQKIETKGRQRKWDSWRESSAPQRLLIRTTSPTVATMGRPYRISEVQRPISSHGKKTISQSHYSPVHTTLTLLAYIERYNQHQEYGNSAHQAACLHLQLRPNRCRWA